MSAFSLSANELKKKLTDYPFTIIYLPLKWCGYAFKLFEQVLQEKSYSPEGEKDPSYSILLNFELRKLIL